VVDANKLGLDGDRIRSHDLRWCLSLKQWIGTIHPVARLFLGSKCGKGMYGNGIRCERHQRNITALLDGFDQRTLVACTYARNTPWDDLALFADELVEQPHFFVVDIFDLVGA
jgi:hypothetical protein